MREIKFRAWTREEDEEDFEMSEPFEVTDLDGYYSMPPITWMTKDEVVIMQYTGLRDKNGTEIYEGDVVKAASAGSHAICQVKWGQGRAGFFLWRDNPTVCWNLSGGGKAYDQESIAVIGNIYENPELLK